ncbi:hypothetical protein C1645_832678 [Glomus cerebriforme]|uniref:Uncharacterized protein n=1 Tax=Glomus cerebriforme TaxID=658196 RepID=A0A397SGY9_9GLOM|nr:hypothetical protein C1645_832678 [Glomus cerebriforme]
MLPHTNVDITPVPYINPHEIQLQERRAKKAQQQRGKNLKKLQDSKRIKKEATKRQLAASVGHSQRRDFTKEPEDQFYDSLRPHFNQGITAAFQLAEDQSMVFADWQDDFHAHMTNSPVTTLSPTTTRAKRKWMNSTLDAPPTLEEILRRHKSSLGPINKFIKRLDCLPVFRAASLKRNSSWSLDDNVVKRWWIIPHLTALT